VDVNAAQPTPASQSVEELTQPTPASQSVEELTQPTPASQSVEELTQPTPASQSVEELTQPTPASQSVEEFNSFTDASRQRVRERTQQSASRRRGTQTRGVIFTQEEVSHLLDLVDEILPITARDWTNIANTLNRAYPQNNRTAEGCRRKFRKLCTRETPAGTPLPPNVVRARAIETNIVRQRGPISAAENVQGDADEQEPPPLLTRTTLVPQPLSNDTFTRFAELMMQRMEEDRQNRLQRERERDEERREEQLRRDEERREEQRRRDEDRTERRALMAILQDLQDVLSDYLHRN
jgi:hypothetical protein